MSNNANLSKKPVLAPEHQQTLRQQAISEDEPGTVLRDLETLLGFIGPTGIQVSSTYHFLPIKLLPSLNAQLSRPVELGLKRPQQKSYPHINGLYLLVRSTGLTYLEEAGAQPRLVLEEAAFQSWRKLNPTERYFTLLEAWLIRGRPEIVGEDRGWRGFPIRQWGEFSHRIPAEGLPIAGDKDLELLITYFPGLYTIALLELFGLISVEHGPPEARKGWRIVRVHRTLLGDALLQLLLTPLSDPRYLPQPHERAQAVFGELQPIIRPFFPEWQNNLILPGPEFQDGIYVFQVSLGEIWRRIAIPARMTLDDLSYGILDAFGFDYDHLYRFIYQNRFGWTVHINHPYLEEGPWTSEELVGDLPLKPGRHMLYVYDFGDWWEFDVTLERIDPLDPKVQKPVILESYGDAPEQYPSWDE